MCSTKLILISLCLAVTILTAPTAESSKSSITQHNAVKSAFNHSSKASSHHKPGIHVAKWNFAYVSGPILVCAFVFCLLIVKMAYHHVKPLAETLPESCALILVGFGIGCLLSFAADEDQKEFMSFLMFDRKTFFLFLLPPIVLEAAFSLRDRAFIENLGVILLYAVVGTITNVALIAIGLWCLSSLHAFNSAVSLLQCLVFASFVAAVDPVAVLAIFEEVGVNKMLYFMVFGESLLNDAVTVVLYNLMIGLIVVEKESGIGWNEVVLGFTAFCCVSGGAITMGSLWGFLCSYITKYTSDIRIVEPAIIFACAYAAYLCAELFEFSGIISIICCGIVQAQYASENLSAKSYITVQYSTKVIAQIMESVIFIILGVMTMNHQRWFWQHWDTMFSISVVVLCLVIRFAIVFVLTFVVNSTRVRGRRHISFQEQFIIGYGGLRGAVSFSLAFALDHHVGTVQTRDMFLAATYAIIFATVFIQGSTMKPLVRLLHIRLHMKHNIDEGFRMFVECNRGVLKNLLMGVEDVIHHHDKHYFEGFRDWLTRTFVRSTGLSRPGQQLLIIHEELEFHKNFAKHPTGASSRALTSQALDALDKSNVPTSFVSKMIGDENENPEKASLMQKGGVRQRRNALTDERGGRQEEMERLRNLIDTSFFGAVHHVDRSLKETHNEAVRRQLAHRNHIRQKVHQHFKVKHKIHKVPSHRSTHSSNSTPRKSDTYVMSLVVEDESAQQHAASDDEHEAAGPSGGSTPPDSSLLKPPVGFSIGAQQLEQKETDTASEGTKTSDSASISAEASGKRKRKQRSSKNDVTDGV